MFSLPMLLESLQVDPTSKVAAGGAIVVCLLTWSLLVRLRRKSSHAFPPSPPANSLFGHILSKEKHPFLTVHSWIEQYGPLISLRGGTEKYVVIGSHKAAVEIMEKHGGALVDRPRLIAAGEILGRGLRVLLTPAGDRFKRMRRALHSHLQPKVARTYEPLQMLHAKDTILGLLESPDKYLIHAQTYAASVIIKLAYGKDTPTHASDPDVVHVRKSVQRVAQTFRPGAYLVDSFPFLKYLPWYARDLRQAFIDDHGLFHRQLDAVKLRMDDPDSGPSFARSLLEDTESGLDETEKAFLAGAMFAAGSDTTSSSICVAMLAAARFPEAQAAVHSELDAVIGDNRAPTFDDEKSLPILRAFILESMRWRPLAPMGLAHRSTEDIVWGGYFIPAGTTVFGSHWAISRDPEVFPNPEKFDIGRWLTSDGEVREDLKFPYFGFGRRVCPGQHIATRSVFINTLLILWSFRISVDESKPGDDFAFISNPRPDIVPTGLIFEPRIPKEMLKSMMEQYAS